MKALRSPDLFIRRLAWPFVPLLRGMTMTTHFPRMPWHPEIKNKCELQSIFGSADVDRRRELPREESVISFWSKSIVFIRAQGDALATWSTQQGAGSKSPASQREKQQYLPFWCLDLNIVNCWWISKRCDSGDFELMTKESNSITKVPRFMTQPDHLISKPDRLIMMAIWNHNWPGRISSSPQSWGANQRNALVLRRKRLITAIECKPFSFSDGFVPDDGRWPSLWWLLSNELVSLRNCMTPFKSAHNSHTFSFLSRQWVKSTFCCKFFQFGLWDNRFWARLSCIDLTFSHFSRPGPVTKMQGMQIQEKGMPLPEFTHGVHYAHLYFRSVTINSHRRTGKWSRIRAAMICLRLSHSDFYCNRYPIWNEWYFMVIPFSSGRKWIFRIGRGRTPLRLHLGAQTWNFTFLTWA
jgi:hypothetical protein